MSTSDRFAELRRAMEDAVLRGAGSSSQALREAAAAASGDPEDLRPLLEKVRRHAYKVTDEDVAAARHGYSQDELWEIITASAVGEARRRIEKVLELLATPPAGASPR